MARSKGVNCAVISCYLFLAYTLSQLADVGSYKILSQGGCTSLDGVDDAEGLRMVKAAFDTIGMEEKTQTQVRAPHRTEDRVVGGLGLRTVVLLCRSFYAFRQQPRVSRVVDLGVWLATS